MTGTGKIHRLHGDFHRYHSGDEVDQTLEEDAVLAVVQGRLQVDFEQEKVLLRPSDALTMPAHTAFHLRALEESLVYLYAEHEQPPIPFGV